MHGLFGLVFSFSKLTATPMKPTSCFVQIKRIALVKKLPDQWNLIIMKLLITTMKLLINTDSYQYNHNLCFNSSGGGLDSYLDNWNSSREKNLFLVNLFAAEELIAYKLSMINQRSWRLSGVIDKECCKIAYGEQLAWLRKQHSS